MKKILYSLEALIFVVCSVEIGLYSYLPSMKVLEPYHIYFVIGFLSSIILILVTLGISFYCSEIGSDVKHKKRAVKNYQRKKVIFDDVTKKELGIPLQPEKVLEEEDNKPEKVVEEQPLSETVIAGQQESKVEEVQPEEVKEPVAEEPVVEESTTEEPAVEEVQQEEPVVEETPVEEVKEEQVEEVVEPVEEEKKEEPIVEEVQPEEPVVEEPQPEEVVEPATEEPVVEETPTEEPVVEESPVEVAPVVEETPTEEPVADEVQPEEPVVEEEPTPVGPALKLQPTILAPFRIFNDYTYSIGKHWTELFQGEVDKTYFKDMVNFLQQAYENKNVYPPKEDLMKCFEYCDFDNTRVVIIGKFPFYRKNQADGLAYSTRQGKSPNQTTSIIIKEAISDVGIPVVNSGSLVNWARNGVLLLNSIMTAPSDKPASHSDCGWVTFTNKIIELLNMDSTPKAFVLWGEYAQELKPLITNPNHLILEAPNPSPLSAANGFYGSKPFSKINEFLKKNNIEPIDWTL